MRVLIDTHILLWAVGRSARLSPEIRAVLLSSNNEIMFSAASIWEIAIKASQNRIDFGQRPSDVAAAAIQIGFNELPVTSAVASLVADLPDYHRDPFDRLIIAQALAGPYCLYTADAVLARYSELVRLVR